MIRAVLVSVLGLSVLLAPATGKALSFAAGELGSGCRADHDDDYGTPSKVRTAFSALRESLDAPSAPDLSDPHDHHNPGHPRRDPNSNDAETASGVDVEMAEDGKRPRGPRPSRDDYPSGGEYGPAQPSSADDHPSGRDHPSGSADDYPVEMAEHGRPKTKSGRDHQSSSDYQSGRIRTKGGARSSDNDDSTDEYGSGDDYGGRPQNRKQEKGGDRPSDNDYSTDEFGSSDDYGGRRPRNRKKDKQHCRAIYSLYCEHEPQDFMDYIDEHALPCHLKTDFPIYLDYFGFTCANSGKAVCEALLSQDRDSYGGHSGDDYDSGYSGSDDFDYGSMDYGDVGSIDYGDTGSIDYGDAGSTDYGDVGSIDYGDTGSIDYGDAGSTDYGSTGSTDYGAVAAEVEEGATKKEGSRNSLASPLKRLMFGA